MSIVKLPEVLCIHLKRFRFDSYFSTKISRHIAFPLNDLDMSAYLKEVSGSHHYTLNAIITHYGGAGGGHYVAFAKNAPRNSWFEFNDTRVRPVSADTVLGAEGYVLFYRRVAPSDSYTSQPFNITSLLPQRGTIVPSPDVCYISRHWLHLLKTCAYPGPIFQYEFACKHGGKCHLVCLNERMICSLSSPILPSLLTQLSLQPGQKMPARYPLQSDGRSGTTCRRGMVVVHLFKDLKCVRNAR